MSVFKFIFKDVTWLAVALVDYQAFVINLCVTMLWGVGAKSLKIDGVIYEQEAF